MMRAIPLRLIYGEGYFACDPQEADHLYISRPGPAGWVILPVQIGGMREGTGNWSWNGSVEKPTLRPSVSTRYRTDADPPGERPNKCHTWITEGKAIFLDDSTHRFAGQTLDLLDASEYNSRAGRPLKPVVTDR